METGQDHTKKYIEDFKKKVKKKVKTSNKNKLSRNNTPVLLYDNQNCNIYEQMGKAEQYARIGLEVPSYSKFPIPKKIIYRWATRILLKVLKIITINQRQFNLSILDTFRSSIDDYNNLKLRFAESKTLFDTKIIELKIKLEQQDIEIEKLNNIVDYLKNSLAQLEQKIKSITKGTVKSVGKIGRGKLQNLTDEVSHSLDSLYVFLEDKLRGNRKEIKKRLNVYIPIIKKANAGLEGSPILDIACGRGEWLELLKEADLYAKGLDSNKIMVKICKQQGLDVTESEALSFIKNVPDNSLGAVTVFHLIEHYGFEFLIELLEEILRVLKSGGLIILETPNPSNVLVGSCNFYLDPTHNKPIPNLLAKLVLESCGFSKVKIMNINPFNDDLKIKEDDFETSKRFNDYFYGPQDYAVVGYKI